MKRESFSETVQLLLGLALLWTMGAGVLLLIGGLGVCAVWFVFGWPQ